jgi:hypothetical protein
MPTTNNLHGQLIDEFKNQLLIVLIKGAGGKVKIPAAEIDATGQDLLSFSVDEQKNFHFIASKKS